ncbi:hypothetical protein B0H16DRAFT_456014 [Mycena metata]|uniref:SET domain-containing protein n=1 Tax=Mycena metata TaxID=1033252 RepID=A0AAD7HAQ3_9AGAR|nr:hypothetical protein B0H16DRAFT_456014 [Mycena metata]
MRHTSLLSNRPADEPVSHCIFYPGSKEVLTELPGFPQPLMHPATPTFRVATFPGKGMGLVSTRALKMGDLILTERPLIAAPQAMPIYRPKNCTDQEHLQRGLAELERHLMIALQRMRPASTAAYLALANSCKKEGLIVGIFLTNGLELAGLWPGVQGVGGNYSAVCKDISRLNHSCSPNTSTSFDLASLSYRLYAVRDIVAGEELTYQYTNVEVPASERRQVLKGYDFVCACAACKDAPASDVRRYHPSFRRSPLPRAHRNIVFRRRSCRQMPRTHCADRGGGFGTHHIARQSHSGVDVRAHLPLRCQRSE